MNNILISFKVCVDIHLAGGTVVDAGSGKSLTKCHGNRELDQCHAHLKKMRQ